MIANPLLRDSAQGVIERLDAQLGPLPILLRALLHQVVVHVGEHRIVYLHDETCLYDLQVLLTKRIGERKDVVALAGIELIDAVEHRARRGDGGEKALGRGRFLQRGLEIRRVAAHVGVLVVLDG